MNQTLLREWPSFDLRANDGWDRIVSQAGLNPSMLREWCELTWKSVGVSTNNAHLFVHRDDEGKVSAVLPFFYSLTRTLGIPIVLIQPMTNLVSYHAELVSLTDAPRLLNQFLLSIPRWDCLHFANVNVAGVTAQAIRSAALELGAPVQTIAGDVSPYLPIDSSWEDFLSTRNKKFRYKLRRRWESMHDSATLNLVWYERGDDIETLLESILHVERRSWKAKVRVAITDDPREIEYHRGLLPLLAAKNMLTACVLYSDQQPIAYSLCCYDRETGWFGQLKTSFDEAHSQVSPGAIVIDASVEQAFRISAKEFDFLGNLGEHKLYWTAKTRTHADFFLYAPRVVPRSLEWMKRMKRYANDWIEAKRSDLIVPAGKRLNSLC